MNKKLIEVALPLESISAEASLRKRKAPAGYPTSIHRWWAQRPISACRAILFASLVDDPSSDPDRFPTLKAQEEERRRLFELIERMILWDNSTNEKVLDEARAEIRRSNGGRRITVIDPFCGGGSIPLEAQRLGLSALASDLNPVAVLLTKGLIEIPSRFADMPPVHPMVRDGIGGTGTWRRAAGLAEDVRRYGDWLRVESERRIGHLYPKIQLPKEYGGRDTTVIAWLWARTVTCPNPACGAEMSLISTLALSTKAGREIRVEPVVDRAARTVSFSVGPGRAAPPPKVGRGANFRCLVCDQIADDDHIKAEGRAGRMGERLMAIVADGPKGRVYLGPSAEQESIARTAVPTWGPDANLANDPRALWTVNYGLTQFRDLFTARQLVALTTFSDLLAEVRLRVLADALEAGQPGEAISPSNDQPQAPAYADAVITYLAFAISRVADYGNALASWRPKDSAMRALFARQAIPMVWDFAEGSPFASSSSGLSEAIAVVAKSLEHLPAAPPAKAFLADATSIQHEGPVAISTDPPYYDNIGYSDLSDFFYVWLRRSLSAVYPDLFATVVTPKANELIATPYRFGGDKKKADRHFVSGLGAAFARMRAIADPEIPVTVYYAFKQAENEEDSDGTTSAPTGWETMLEGLLTAGFAIQGTWPIRTEGDNRQIGIGTNALASSIVLVCRPRAVDAHITDRRGLVAALKAELPEALRTLQHGNIAPVDLAQAAIGPGMAVFSRFGRVVEPDGRSMSVRTALGLINQVLGEVLAEQEDEFDADTRWAVTWFEQYRHEPADYDRATVLARARGVGMNGLEAAGIVASKAGKTRLLPRAELDPAWDPQTDARITVWEVAQHLIRALSVGGESAAADLTRRVGGLGESARDLAYRLYAICERKKWAEEALGYNALVAAWPEITRLAASGSGNEARQQTQLFS